MPEDMNDDVRAATRAGAEKAARTIVYTFVGAVAVVLFLFVLFLLGVFAFVTFRWAVYQIA